MTALDYCSSVAFKYKVLVEPTYDWNCLTDHHNALWFAMIRQDFDGIENKVIYYFTLYPDLLEAHDAQGLKASYVAIGRVKDAMMEVIRDENYKLYDKISLVEAEINTVREENIRMKKELESLRQQQMCTSCHLS
jgi:hypothetical protein